MRALIEQIKSTITLSSIISPRVRLTRRGKDLWGLCPFHKEKSSSFVVHDDTGRYHCFGCEAAGDVFTFLQETRNLSFREAVEELAGQLGLSVPRQTFENPERPRKPLYEIMAQSTHWFQENLRCSGGEQARDYLRARQISTDAITAFQLGWAPGEKNALFNHLTGCGMTADQLLEGGVILPERRMPKDRFRKRLIFPISDNRGRIIAFGGRTLENLQPKYLNSPETPLFNKSQELYGFWQATQTLSDKPVVLVEGYFDVISLQAAHLARALAPLGTTLSETQLEKAWKLSSTPLICFDGDEAGDQAAQRAAKRVLPLLKPGYSLQFCTLPRGEDPQSLLAQGNPQTLNNLFKTAIPLVDFLWNTLCQKPSETPEARAELKKRYQICCRQIVDPEIRRLYENEFAKRFREQVSPPWFKKSQPKVEKPRMPPLSTKAKALLQIKILLLVSIQHPQLLGEFEEALATLTVPEGPLEKIRACVLHWCGSLDLSLENVTLGTALEQGDLMESVQTLLMTPRVSQHALFARSNTPEDDVRQGFWDVFEHYQRETTLQHELQEARTAFAQNMQEKSWKRLQKLKEIYTCTR